MTNVLVAVEDGDTVFSRGDCGDFHEGKSVVVPNGIRGEIVRTFTREDGMVMVEVSVPASPGQKVLSCRARDFGLLWEPGSSHVRTHWERLMED